jgi:hypothetical protein
MITDEMALLIAPMCCYLVRGDESSDQLLIVDLSLSFVEEFGEANE